MFLFTFYITRSGFRYLYHITTLYKKQPFYIILLVMGCLALASFYSCVNKKNTAFTRAYHSINTRYNVHFNASEAYKESIKQKEQQQENNDHFSQLLHIYPEILDSSDLKHKGNFATTIEKTTKAIKLHSIKTRPRRDPNKRADKDYQEWLKQKEFNPFLVNTWMLLAKAEFEEGSYLRAITTFMYISKIYANDKKVVSEAKLWIARAYSEMGWRYEAENVLRKMEQNEEVHQDLVGMYASIKANLFVRAKDYKSAIPFLEETVEYEKNTSKKRRNKYLLGQLYAEIGEKQKAYDTFGSVRGMSTPYKYSINSKLRQIEVSGETKDRMIAELKRMLKNSSNKEYLDHIYSTLGDVYMNSSDTIEAISSYSQAIKQSVKSNYDKAFAQIKLGGLYFDRKEYVKAQPHYAGALSILKRTDEYYPLVSQRSEVLDQLIVYVNTVHEQDSLLHLANMSEMERITFIEAHIAKLKEEEERKLKEAELAERRDVYSQKQYTGWDDLNMQKQNSLPVISQQKGSDFYFYNTQTVEQGKISFEKKWGKRTLADDWRRRDKEIISEFEEMEELVEEGNQSDIENNNSQSMPKELVTDQYFIEYYLQQLPLTSEEKEASMKMIDDGLFNMGLIYKNLLEDNQLAIETFEINLKRFPATLNKEEIYYQLFLIYLKMDNEPLMALYRNLILSDFGGGVYAKPLSDDNYAWNFKFMGKIQEDLYQKTYDAYLNADVNTVRTNYKTIQEKYPFVSLMPKFAFLNSLSYAQTKDASQLEKNLKKLISDYPKSDVVPLASSILNNIKDGMILLSDGSPLVGMDWTMAYANDSILGEEAVRLLAYQTDTDKAYTLQLMFRPNSIDRNELLYQVADYNFSNYVIQTYDLKFDDNPLLSSLEISGFKDYKTIELYLRKAFEDEGLMTQLDPAIIPIPMSKNNYTEIYPRLGLEQYLTFYADSLGSEIPELLACWKQSNDKEDFFVLPEILTETIIDKDSLSTIEIIPETGERRFTPTDLTSQHKKSEKGHDKEIGLTDLLTQDQVKGLQNIMQKKDETMDALQGLINNPVEGLKNIFNRNTLEENLSKEEKELSKREEKILKIKADSIKRLEAWRLDSLALVEKNLQDTIQMEEKIRKDQAELEKNEKIRKQREEEEIRRQETRDKERMREQQLRKKEDRRRLQERERQDSQKQRERDRKELQKRKEAERKKREKETEEERKQREKERQDLLKQRTR